MDALTLAFFLHLAGLSSYDEAGVADPRLDEQETEWQICGETQFAGSLRELGRGLLKWRKESSHNAQGLFDGTIGEARLGTATPDGCTMLGS